MVIDLGINSFRDIPNKRSSRRYNIPQNMSSEGHQPEDKTGHLAPRWDIQYDNGEGLKFIAGIMRISGPVIKPTLVKVRSSMVGRYLH